MGSIRLNLVAICSVLLLSSAAQASIYEPNVLWGKSEIRVCFYAHPNQLSVTEYGLSKSAIKQQGFTPSVFSKEEKDLIKKITIENYSKETTGIEFTEWADCEESREFDAMIVKAAKIDRKLWFDKKVQFRGKSSIGEQGVYSMNGYREKNLTVKPVVLFTEMLPYTVSHEFGHLAGLRHEHVHPEAKTLDKQCTYVNLFTERLQSSVIQDYDSKSIMNYCRRDDVNNGVLSDKDKSTLKSLYSSF